MEYAGIQDDSRGKAYWLILQPRHAGRGEVYREIGDTMARLRRRTILTRRVSVRYTETNTRALCRRIMDDMLTPDMIQRGFRVSHAQPIYDDLGTELLGYKYDVTALI